MTAIDLVLVSLVLAAMAAIALVDARRAIVDPRLVLALVGAGLAWRLFGSGGSRPLWTAAAGAALGVLVIALPILAAHLARRRWPVFPGDAMMLGGFGFVLGPLGLGWSLLIGAAFALVHRACLQYRRGRPFRRGYCPLGPGMAAGAMTVFLCLVAGVALAAEESAATRQDGQVERIVSSSSGDPSSTPVNAHRDKSIEATELSSPAGGPLAATELAPSGPPLPGELAAKDAILDLAEPASFPAIAKRIAALAGAPVEIEERPSRIAGGEAALPDPPALRLVFAGPLPGLLDAVAARSGYDWEWRDGAIVFHRHWDVEQRAALSRVETEPEAGTEPRSEPWTIDRKLQPTLREVLESWASRAGWSVVWKPARTYAVGADAAFDGGFLEAVDLLLSAPATRRSLVATAYEANRHLVIEDAGAVR